MSKPRKTDQRFGITAVYTRNDRVPTPEAYTDACEAFRKSLRDAGFYSGCLSFKLEFYVGTPKATAKADAWHDQWMKVRDGKKHPTACVTDFQRAENAERAAELNAADAANVTKRRKP